MQYPKVLIIGYVWPEPKSSAAGLRDWNLINTFVKAKWELSYASPSKESQYSESIRELGIPTHTIQANDNRFDDFVRELNPDYVVFDRFVTEEQFGWRVEEQCPRSVRVLDSQDLHFLRRGREQALGNGASLEDIKKCNFDLISEVTLRELASIYRCDSTLILSDFEFHLLTEDLKIQADRLFLSRFHYPSILPFPDFQDRADFMMIGNFRHPPNADGILWFRQEIWPQIREKLPTVNVFIYGAYPPKSMMQLTDKKQGFHVVGTTPDQFEVLRKHRVNLAPLRFGAGIKGKISDGWWSGTPVVTTPIGAEGMQEDLAWGGEIVTSPKDFAQKSVELYTEESLWRVHQKNALHLIEKLYSDEANSRALIDHLVRVKTGLDLDRKSNLMGAILRHHLHKSTKYFSKWIEAKNERLSSSIS